MNMQSFRLFGKVMGLAFGLGFVASIWSWLVVHLALVALGVGLAAAIYSTYKWINQRKKWRLLSASAPEVKRAQWKLARLWILLLAWIAWWLMGHFGDVFAGLRHLSAGGDSMAVAVFLGMFAIAVAIVSVGVLYLRTKSSSSVTS